MTQPPRDPRRRVRRDVVRLLVLDPDDRLLLLGDSDVHLTPAPRWWTTPGGGVEPGETHRQTAVRELWEETGFIVTEDEIEGPVATRDCVHGFCRVILDQLETFYLVRVAGGDVQPGALTDDETEATWAMTWFTRADLDGIEEDVWPDTLGDLWDGISARHTWPLTLPPGTESSLAVDESDPA